MTIRITGRGIKERIRKTGTRRAVILFTRIPEAGRVKTRMMPYLSAEECRDLQMCFLRDVRSALAKSGADIIVCCDAGNPAVLRSIFGKRVRYIPQRGSGLGEKMCNAFTDAHDLGYTSCLLMGSDIPDIRTADISEAFDRLEQNDIVIGPSADGEILFFLHCDSELPEDPAGEIRRIMAKYEAGCFGIAFHSKHFFMLTNRVISNLRAKHHRIMFGDQGIFMTRELFRRAGGFPEIPIMEDYQLSLTLREMGIRTGIARHRIYTSDRRYPQQTRPMLELMAGMYRLRREYKAGKPPEDIAKEYRDIR